MTASPAITKRPQPLGKLSLPMIMRALVSDQLIDANEAEEYLNSHHGSAVVQMHPLELVAGANFTDIQQNKPLDLERLTQWLAQWADCAYYRIDPLKIKARDIANVMSFAFAQRHGILAVEVNSQEIVIATAQPFDNSWMDNLSHVVRKPIRKVVINPTDLRRYTIEFYNLARSVDNASGDNDSSRIHNFEQLLELGKEKDYDANDQHIVNIVDWLLQYAFEQRASDIHLEPRRDITQVRFRIDGMLHNVYEFPGQVGLAIISRLKILGRLNVAEKRKPQDGRIKTLSASGKEIELRLSTLPTAFGEKLVMRIFDPDVLVKPFSALGFSRDDVKRWEHMSSQPNGIILVTGPTGSGKTTTLYSTLKQLAKPEVNVCTVEDPIEMVEPMFNQMQVQSNIGVTFASGIRALMRQDPDIIMIGEIRDLETAEMATQAALTGHLVLSTMHTNDAPSAITRLMELGIPPYIVRATVIGIMAQRLVRTLCPHCKQPHPVDDDLWKVITTPWRMVKPELAFGPVGCLECRDTGYQKREGIYEIMTLSPAIRALIDDNANLTALRRQAIKEGMLSLSLSGAQKVKQGHTSVAEVLRVAPQTIEY